MSGQASMRSLPGCQVFYTLPCMTWVSASESLFCNACILNLIGKLVLFLLLLCIRLYKVMLINQHAGVIREQPKSLTPEDLKNVRNFTFSAREKWFDIGLELGIPQEDLKCIKNDYPQSSKSQFREMLIIWLKMVNPKPTWRALIKALQHPSVREEGLADTLRQKYCPNILSRKAKKRESTTVYFSLYYYTYTQYVILQA